MTQIAIWLIFSVLLAQEEAEQKPPPRPPVDPVPIMAAAREAYLAGNYEECLDVLTLAIEDHHGEALMLAADANFMIDTPRSRRKAINFYERCLYEDQTIPFPDHSYRQLARIYLAEMQRAEARNLKYETRDMADEARFYMERLLKKYPNSFYRDVTLNDLLNLSIRRGDYEKTQEVAGRIWESATNGRLLTRVEPIIFINQEPFNETLASIDGVFNAHRPFIEMSRDVLFKFAQRYEDVGALDRAREIYLTVYNIWPHWGDSASSLRRLADLHRRQGEFEEAAFLFKLIMLFNPNTLAEAEAMLGVAEMMERGQVSELKIDDTLTLTYRDLVDRIRHSILPDDIRARYHYRLALFQSFSDVNEALMIMRNMLNEYEKGPFLGLYRRFYEDLLFTTIDRNYNAGNDWELDRLYTQHQQLLAFTPNTQYPHKIAKAYIRLDLPASAHQVYENMWSFKQSITGFDLAFEEPLNDHLRLLNTLRDDDALKFRLSDYAALYNNRDRFYDPYLFVKTMYESRTMTPEDFLERVRELDPNIKNIWDARRLRRMAVFAQEQNEAQLAKSLYDTALNWQPLLTALPDLHREARLYQADHLFDIGNYYESERRYQLILGNTDYHPSDRDWAYLQLARLHEFKGEDKTAIRIYGQLAYSTAEYSAPLAAYAKQRLFSISSVKELDERIKELGFDQQF